MKEEILTSVNECRLLVFLETNPQTNTYNQVILSPEQFKKVSDATGEKTDNNQNLKEGFEMFKTTLSEEKYILPDLQSISYE